MRSIFFLFGIGILFSSCSEDFFSQTLDIDPPEYDKQFVLHGFGSNTDSVFRVSLTQNYGILEQVADSAWAVPDATLELYEGGQKIATLYHSIFISAFFESAITPGFFQAGKTYDLRASHPDFPTVICSQTMPDPVAVDSVRFREKAGVDSDGSRLSAIDAFIHDEPGVENYYEIRVSILYPDLEFNYDSLGNLIVDTIGYQSYPREMTDSDDPNALITYGGGIAVSDRFFDGESYKFVAKFYESSGFTYQVSVRAVTEQYYLWSISAERKYNSDDNPLAEPVTTYTNLENGIGAFGLVNEQIFVVD